MKEITFKSWIKISNYGCMSNTTRGIEVSSDFYVRLFKIPNNESEIIVPTVDQITLKELEELEGPEIIYSELLLLSSKQQAHLKEKRNEIDFNIFKNEYYNPEVMDGGTTTFEIVEENFTKTIRETNFSLEGTEYDILERFISYVDNLGAKVEML